MQLGAGLLLLLLTSGRRQFVNQIDIALAALAHDRLARHQAHNIAATWLLPLAAPARLFWHNWLRLAAGAAACR